MFSRRLHQLKELKEYSASLPEIELLDEFLHAAAEQGWTRFSPALFAQQWVLELERATDLLLMCAAELDLLAANFEVECPCCGNSHFKVSDISQLSTDERLCPEDDEFYQPRADLVWITFDLASEVVAAKKEFPPQ